MGAFCAELSAALPSNKHVIASRGIGGTERVPLSGSERPLMSTGTCVPFVSLDELRCIVRNERSDS